MVLFIHKIKIGGNKLKRPLLYTLIVLAVIAVVFGAWQIFGKNRDLTESSLVPASSTPIVTPIRTIAPSITITPTLTSTIQTPTQTATSTLTKTATKAPTFTITPTRTPQPPAPIVIVPTNTPGPTGDGYVNGTPWNYEQTPVYTPGVP